MLRKYSKWAISGLSIAALALIGGCGVHNSAGSASNSSADASANASASHVSTNVASHGAVNSKARSKSAKSTSSQGSTGSLSQLSHLTVMGTGGSIAQGDKATNGNGYLQLTFAHFHDKYVNKAIYGANSTQLSTMYKGDFTNWLSQVRPQVVVISWGLLNDVLPKTPIDKFNEYLTEEIQQALAANATVFIVTPPVTEFYYSYQKQEGMYAEDEVNLVKQMNNPHVYAYDLLTQMSDYIKTHNLDIKGLSGDAHHPNDKGYQLAANLLTEDLSRNFK